MPTYGYHCTNCNQEIEVQQRMSDQPLTVCPKCEGRLEKLLYPVGVQFKGSGFYSTDYRSQPEAKSSESSEGKKSSETGDKAKAEAKPEKKSGDEGSKKEGVKPKAEASIPGATK
ncbi:MAG: FmdB family zinc ribbon protein [Candidatus Dormibacteraceae bacterium]